MHTHTHTHMHTHIHTHTHTHTQARDIYEESIQTVTTVRDFGQVFDAYAQFEESMINAKMETTAEMGATDDGTRVRVGVCMYEWV